MADRPTYPNYLGDTFARDVAEHQLTILHDDGLYRHLRCARPGSGIERFDIVTWPGHLHIGGDRDGYTFSRVKDMFEFFRRRGGGRINPQYWAEKLTDGRERAKAYSRERAEEQIWSVVRSEYQRERAEEQIWSVVRSEYQNAGRAASGLAKAVHAELIADCDAVLDYEETARAALDEFKHTTETGEFRFHDSWELDLQDWDYHYLWSCHAIVWGIAQYDAAIAAQPGSDHSQPPSSRLTCALHGIPDTAQPWQRRTTTALAEAGITVGDLRAMATAAGAR